MNPFSRTQMLLGEEALQKLAKSTVAVFGIGGVGSFVVEGLARAGIGNFVLIDADTICTTNINRQIHANINTVGQDKVEAMKERILAINPNIKVKALKAFYLPETAEQIFPQEADYIVDAIDTMTGKINLILTAKKHNIPIISAMGAGNKLDPTKFEVSDIFSTSIDPLARVLRKKLKEHGIDKLKVVYSKETPLAIDNIKVENNHKENDTSVQIYANRRSTPGSVSFVPSVMGLIIAGEVVKDIVFDRL